MVQGQNWRNLPLVYQISIRFSGGPRDVAHQVGGLHVKVGEVPLPVRVRHVGRHCAELSVSGRLRGVVHPVERIDLFVEGPLQILDDPLDLPLLLGAEVLLSVEATDEPTEGRVCRGSRLLPEGQSLSWGALYVLEQGVVEDRGGKGLEVVQGRVLRHHPVEEASGVMLEFRQDRKGGSGSKGERWRTCRLVRHMSYTPSSWGVF